jgi:outer membrane protein TolC
MIHQSGKTRGPRRRLTSILAASFLSCCAAFAQTNQVVPLALRDAIHTALRNNRLLQIEQINPDIARATLSGAWAAYDPVFFAQAKKENSTDTGGFNPLTGQDVAFSAESEVVNTSLTGVLPTGLSYGLTGEYIYSEGQQELLFSSYRLGADITLRQPLLRNFWIDQFRYTIHVSRNNIKISEQGVRFVAMTVASEVRQAYAELGFAWDSLRVQQDLLQTRQNFLRGIRRQVEVGTFTVLEERIAQSQEAAVRITLFTASNAIAMAANNLKTLLGYTATNWTMDVFSPSDGLIVVPRRFHLVTSWDRGLVNRPDLAQLNYEVKNAQVNVKYRRNQLFPSLDIIGGYGRRGSSSLSLPQPESIPSAPFTDAWDQLTHGDAPKDMVGLILTFPLSLTGERASFRESKLLRQQAELRVKEKEELIMREVADAIQFAQSSYDRLQTAREATRFAEQALAAEEQKLIGGEGDVFFVLQSQTDLAAARTREILAKRDYNVALAQLDFAEGTILDQEKIDIVIE